MASTPTPIDLPALRRQLWALLAPESNFLWVIVIYGAAISVMTLAVPIAVQTLINSIANIGSLRAVYSLALTLLIILLSYGALSAATCVGSGNIPAANLCPVICRNKLQRSSSAPLGV